MEGVTNWVMGVSFITEGAIPFASKYPKDIWWPNVLRAALTGLIIGLLGVGVSAPHGGIFVIALVGGYENALGFALPIWGAIITFIGAILVGSSVSAAGIVTMRTKTVKNQNS